MRTAKELLKEYSEKYAKSIVEYNLTEEGIIEAMKEYARQYAQEIIDKHEVRYVTNGMGIWDIDSLDLELK